MYDGPYCSERCGSNYGAGSTASEMEEYYGDPMNGDYDPEWVAEVEGLIRDKAIVTENRILRDENEYLREELERVRQEDEA